MSLSQDNEQVQRSQSRAESLNCAHNSLLDFVEDLPSQAVLPTPELPFPSQRNDNSGACEAQEAGNELQTDTEEQHDMPPRDDEQCYVPERTKSGRRATATEEGAHTTSSPSLLMKRMAPEDVDGILKHFLKFAGQWTR